jgi:hypothetical protein
MKEPIVFAAASLAAVILCGCAGYTVRPISGAKLGEEWREGDAGKGYVFYQPELYFLVTRGATPGTATNKSESAATDKSAGAITVTPLYLPNPAKAYRVTTYNFLAKSDFEFTFKDGWQLTSITDKGDNTTVANALAGQLGSVISSALKSIQATDISPANTNTFLLRPEYNSKGVIIGFVAIPSPLKSE